MYVKGRLVGILQGACANLGRTIGDRVASIAPDNDDCYFHELVDELEDLLEQMRVILQDEWFHPPSDDEEESEFEEYSGDDEDMDDEPCAKMPRAQADE